MTLPGTFSSRSADATWTDLYGTGRLVVAFEPGFRAFRGSWYDDTIPLPHDRPEGGVSLDRNPRRRLTGDLRKRDAGPR